jgi:hypothetical protein
MEDRRSLVFPCSSIEPGEDARPPTTPASTVKIKSAVEKNQYSQLGGCVKTWMYRCRFRPAKEKIAGMMKFIPIRNIAIPT